MSKKKNQKSENINRPFQVDVCIGSLRCHSQALTIKLKQHVLLKITKYSYKCT